MKNSMTKVAAWILVFLMPSCAAFFGVITYLAYQESFSAGERIFFFLEGVVLCGMCIYPFILGLAALAGRNFSDNTGKERYDKLPHFGNILKKEQVMKIIEGCQFSPYTTRDGEILKNITISEDEKWIRILGGNLPLDLICGYNPEENELYAIDGSAIQLPRRARRKGIKREIEAFFGDRGICYSYMPTYSGKSYRKARTFSLDSLDQEDFGRMRYLWEKSMVNDKYGYWRKNANVPKYEPVLMNGVIDTAIFERVLSDSDIQRTADAVRCHKTRLAAYLNFEEYRNEYSVCNGIELLKLLGHPKNEAGIDFLFECLGDVDEAYFRLAVEVLHKYPRQNVTNMIEERVKLAYENYDVVGLAGLMFLAKDFNYKIEYVEEVKKAQAEDAQKKQNSDQEVPGFLQDDGDTSNGSAGAGADGFAGAAVNGSMENEIPEFKFDEAMAFGSEEVQEFGAGSVAYKKDA